MSRFVRREANDGTSRVEINTDGNSGVNDDEQHETQRLNSVESVPIKKSKRIPSLASTTKPRADADYA